MRGLRGFQKSGEFVNDTHVQSSMAMISEAAALAGSGCAALLGCGECREIPVRHLTELFDRIDFVDLDGHALDYVAKQCRQWGTAEGTCFFYHSDLTGVIARVETQAQDITATASDPSSCLDRLGELLTTARPNFWRPPTGGEYKLIVCSAVLTQLQATVRERLESIFLKGFPGQRSAMSSHERWRSSAWNFARNLEDEFILSLEALCPEGIIYLSDTVHVCWLMQSGPQAFTTEGAWVATRTSRLADYLHPWNEVLAEQKWQWMKIAPEGPYSGCLFGVQALIYRRARPQGAPLNL